MRARFLAAGVAVLAVLCGASPAAAASAKFNPPKRYYLSLGDSLAFGFQQALFGSEFYFDYPHAYTPADFPGFAVPFAAAMRSVDPGLTLVNYGCPGETTASFKSGCAFQDGLGAALHDGYPGMSQEAAALGFIKAHPGQVSPITLSLGVNDVTSALLTCVIADDATPACVGPPIAAMAVRLTSILDELRTAAPSAEIIVTMYYDPFFPVLGSTADTVALGLDSAIAGAAASARAMTANTFPVINAGYPTDPAGEETSVCTLTLMCTPPPATLTSDIHPSTAGYGAIAGVFWDSSGYGRLASP